MNKKKIEIVKLKVKKIDAKFKINLISLLSVASSDIHRTPNCGINSNCHGNSSECCNRH